MLEMQSEPRGGPLHTQHHGEHQRRTVTSVSEDAETWDPLCGADGNVKGADRAQQWGSSSES